MTSVPPELIPVVVAGALGRMGAEVIKAVHLASDCELVGAVDTTPGKEGVEVGEELGIGVLEELWESSGGPLGSSGRSKTHDLGK